MSSPSDLFDLRMALDLVTEAAESYRADTPASVLDALAAAQRVRADETALRTALVRLHAAVRNSEITVPAALAGRVRMAAEKALN